MSWASLLARQISREAVFNARIQFPTYDACRDGSCPMSKRWPVIIGLISAATLSHVVVRPETVLSAFCQGGPVQRVWMPRPMLDFVQSRLVVARLRWGLTAL